MELSTWVGHEFVIRVADVRNTSFGITQASVSFEIGESASADKYTEGKTEVELFVEKIIGGQKSSKSKQQYEELGETPDAKKFMNKTRKVKRRYTSQTERLVYVGGIIFFVAIVVGAILCIGYFATTQNSEHVKQSLPTTNMSISKKMQKMIKRNVD